MKRYDVFRFGDIEPSGFAYELQDARWMLVRSNIEGEVREPDGSVVYVHKPTMPLAERIARTTTRVEQAKVAKALAERELAHATKHLERLRALHASRQAAKCVAVQVEPQKDGAA